MNNKQITAIGVGVALGTSIGTTIGAVTNNIAMSTVYGSIIGTIIGVVIALVLIEKIQKKMKEYKVIQPKLGFRNRFQSFEDLLNQYSREGWTVNFIGQNWSSVVLERDKNR